jgi:hypothetical protein
MDKTSYHSIRLKMFFFVELLIRVVMLDLTSKPFLSRGRDGEVDKHHLTWASKGSLVG